MSAHKEIYERRVSAIRDRIVASRVDMAIIHADHSILDANRTKMFSWISDVIGANDFASEFERPGKRGQSRQ
jgi:hypothetical protein